MTDSSLNDLPLIDELVAAPDFAAMTDWLSQCPLALFVTHGGRMSAVCEERGHLVGLAYVQTVSSELRRVRRLPYDLSICSVLANASRELRVRVLVKPVNAQTETVAVSSATDGAALVSSPTTAAAEPPCLGGA